jgi:hypothetical protein
VGLTRPAAQWSAEVVAFSFSFFGKELKTGILLQLDVIMSRDYYTSNIHLVNLSYKIIRDYPL